MKKNKAKANNSTILLQKKMKEYFKLQPIKDILASNERKGYVFARDLHSAKRSKSFYYTDDLEDAYEFIYKKTPRATRHFYEIILPWMPVKIHLDIDCSVPSLNVAEIEAKERELDAELDEFIARLRDRFSLTPEQCTYQVLTANGTADDEKGKKYKISRHVIFDRLVVRENVMLKPFMKADPINTDTGIYTLWRLYRMWGNVKKGSERYLLLNTNTAETPPTFEAWKNTLVQYYGDIQDPNSGMAILDLPQLHNQTTLETQPYKSMKKAVLVSTDKTSSCEEYNGLLDWLHEHVVCGMLFEKTIVEKYYFRASVKETLHKGKKSLSIKYGRTSDWIGKVCIRCPLFHEQTHSNAEGHSSNGFTINVYLLARTIVFYCYGTSGHEAGVNQMRVKTLVPKEYIPGGFQECATEIDLNQPDFCFEYKESCIRHSKTCECDLPIWVEKKKDRRTRFTITTRCMLCDSITIHKKKK